MNQWPWGFLLVIFLHATAALAALTVTPESPWTNSNNTTYYYHSVTDLPMDTNYRTFDFTQTYASDSTTNRRHQLLFQVQSSTNFSVTGTQNLVIQLFTGTARNTTVPVPIATVNGVPCSASTCQYVPVAANGMGYYFAAKYTAQQTMTIGIYLSDLCHASYITASSSPALGCDTTTGEFVAPMIGSLAEFNELTFAVGVAADANSGTDLSATTIDKLEYNIKVQTEGPQLICTTYPSETYRPGDGAVFLDVPSVMAGTQVHSNSGLVPLQNLFAIASETGSLDLSVMTNNSVNARLPVTGTQPLLGFNNTKDGTDHQYQMAFAFSDLSGALSGFGCTINNVQASEILTFMKKGQCFIATAAFRSSDVWPVRLLRKFRDQVLLKNRLGQSFVAYYYEKSPPIAQWLLTHPAWRYGVIALLIPLIGVAWMMLHFEVLICFALLLFLGLAFVQIRKKKKRVAVSGLFLFLLLTSCFYLQHSYADPLPAQPQGQTYIDQIKSNLKPEKEETSGSLIDRIKKEQVPDKEEGSYTQRLKQQISPSAEKQPLTTTPQTDEEKELDKRSPIAEIKSGNNYELQSRRSGQVNHLFGFKLGSGISRSFWAKSGIQSRNFSEVYQNTWTPDFRLDYEYQPFHSEWFGNIGLYLAVGFTYNHGKGIYAVGNLPKPAEMGGGNFGTDAQVKLSFVTFPCIAGATYRFNLFRLVRPYVFGGGVVMPYTEVRTDNAKDPRGVSTGVIVGGGANLFMNWLTPWLARNLYDAYGIQHYYFTVEFSRLNILAGELREKATGIMLGFAYEY